MFNGKYIKKIYAYHQFDSRGYPTLAVIVYSNTGKFAKALVPSGASTGKNEAWELRDNKKDEFLGKGVSKAINNVNKIINSNLVRMNIFDQQAIDWKMIQLDGTCNKAKLGANAILGVSLAVAKLAALELEIELYEYIAKYLYKNDDFKYRAPQIMVNIVNGGVHAQNNLNIQEFMIIPKKTSIYNQTKMASEIFHTLAKVLKEKKYSIAKGDEGGYDTNFKSNDDAFESIMTAIRKAKYKPSKDVTIGLDVAASELYVAKDKYDFKENRKTSFNSTELIKYYEKICNQFPISSIEDPFNESDFKNFSILTSLLPNVMIVGDDLYCTHKSLLEKGIKEKATNAILIKLNQVGTLTETIETIKCAKMNNQKVIISHRSGETEDTTIADLAVAVNADFIKTGSFSRSERLAKYNRLLEIENLINQSKT